MIRNADGVESRDTTRVVERTQSTDELDGAPSSKLGSICSLRRLLLLLVLVALGLGAYYLYTQHKSGTVSVDNIMDSLKQTINGALPASNEAPAAATEAPAAVTEAPAAAPVPTEAPKAAPAPPPPARDIPEQPAVADV